MAARRTNSRRRRVLHDEIGRAELAADTLPDEANDSESGDSKRRRAMSAYSSRARRRNQLKTTDLLPKRWPAVTATIVAILTGVATLNALAWFSPGWHRWIGDEGVAALAMTGHGTLGQFCVVSMSLLASLICWQIYSLRQHRRDDYQGAYRIWVWAAICCFLASVNQVVDLRAIASNVVESLSQKSFDENQFAMLGIELLVLSLIVTRGLFEIRASRAAALTLTIAWLSMAGSVAIAYRQLHPAGGWFDADIAAGNFALVSVGSLVASLLFFARYVYLHAHGLLRRIVRSDAKPSGDEKPVVKPKKSAKPRLKIGASAESESVPEAVSPPAKPAPPAKASAPSSRKKSRRKAAPKIAEPAIEAIETPENDESSAPATIKMSKSQRRRQKKAERLRKAA